MVVYGRGVRSRVLSVLRTYYHYRLAKFWFKKPINFGTPRSFTLYYQIAPNGTVTTRRKQGRIERKRFFDFAKSASKIVTPVGRGSQAELCNQEQCGSEGETEEELVMMDVDSPLSDDETMSDWAAEEAERLERIRKMEREKVYWWVTHPPARFKKRKNLAQDQSGHERSDRKHSELLWTLRQRQLKWRVRRMLGGWNPLRGMREHALRA